MTTSPTTSAIPIPANPMIEGGRARRRRPPHPHGRPGRLPAVRAVRGPSDPAAAGTRAAGRPGTCARTRCGRPAGRAPMRPGCRSCPGSSATTRSRPGRSAMRCASPRTATREAYIYPARHHAERLDVDLAAADGPAGPAQGVVRHEPALAARPGHRRGAQALRDDPRRQRLALVHQRHERPALRR